MPYKSEEKRKQVIKRWRLANPSKVAATHRRNKYKKRYGITLEQRGELLKKQRNRCPGCRTRTPGNRGWATDHCHKRGHVRGMLCNNCNLCLGHAKDKVNTLRRLANYLVSNK